MSVWLAVLRGQCCSVVAWASAATWLCNHISAAVLLMLLGLLSSCVEATDPSGAGSSAIVGVSGADVGWCPCPVVHSLRVYASRVTGSAFAGAAVGNGPRGCLLSDEASSRSRMRFSEGGAAVGTRRAAVAFRCSSRGCFGWWSR